MYRHFEQTAKGSLHWDERVRARMPLPDEADVLKMVPGTPVLQVTRLTCADKIPVAVEEITARGDVLEVGYPVPVQRIRPAK